MISIIENKRTNGYNRYTNSMLKKIKLFLLENQTVRQTVFKNAFWLTAGQTIGRLIRAIIIIYAARVLGAAEYGVFSYAFTLAAFFTILTDFSINAIFTREAVKNPKLKSHYFSTAFFIKSILATIGFLIIIFFIPYFTAIKEAAPLLPIMALLLIFDTFRDFAFGYTRAIEKMEIEAGVFIATNIFIVILSLAALFISPTSFNLAVSYAIGSGLGTLIIIWLLRKEFLKVFNYFKKELIYPIMAAAWPFALVAVLGAIMLNTDTIMIGMMKDSSSVGLYSAAQRPIQLLYVLPALLAAAVFPVFSRTTGKDDKKMRGMIEKSLKALFLIAIPLTLGGLILAKDLIKLVFGNEYLASTPTFQILLLTLFFVYPGTIIANAIFAYNRQKIFIWTFLMGAIGNVILNAMLIPLYGIAGAAIASVIAQAINNGFLWWKLKKINNFKVLAGLVKIASAALIMVVITAVLKLLGVNLIINIMISAAAYAALLYILKEKIIYEIKNLVQFKT